jgi:cell division protein FtsZ
MKFNIPQNNNSIIRVIGVGGGGGNAVGHMYRQGITGVDFAICNTDAQALDNNPVPVKIALGPNLTNGRGAGNTPDVGKQCCIESIEEVRSWLSEGTKMLFITAGMGGGTGTGAAPIIAKAAKELDILTVGIVTLPFKFEGMKRQRQAHEGLEQLKKNVDALLVISNDKLKMIHGNLGLSEAFGEADDILTTAAKGIAEIITIPGYINVDFEDVNTVMRNSGVAIMGSGIADGEDRARKAIMSALNSPLLEDNDIRGAQHILLNITSGTKEVTMSEISEITEHLQDEAGHGTDLIWGNCTDETLGDKIQVTLIATGFSEGASKKVQKEAEPIMVPLEPDVLTIVSSDEFVGQNDADHGTQVVFDFDVNEMPMTSRPASPREFTPPVNKPRQEQSSSRYAEMEAARREATRRSTSIPLDNPKAIADMENVPAYERRKVNLDDNIKATSRAGSSYAVSMDDDQNVFLSNNSFLYNNVD